LRQIELIFMPENEPERLDLFVARSVSELTRAMVQRLVDDQLVLVDRRPAKASLKLKGGELVTVEIPPPLPTAPIAEDIPLSVCYEDGDVIVVNKVAGMVVHPAAGNPSGTLVNALLSHCHDLSGIGGEIRPGIVHRLDKETSGLLVVAKNDLAHQELSRQFKDHTIKRVYYALVYGVPREDRGKITGVIGRHPTDRKRMSGQAKHGRHAVTHWQVLARYQGMTLLRLRLETGRTHQIRVHLSEAGYPLVGDPVYGGSGREANLKDPLLKKLVLDLGRQALHAKLLGFVHPVTKDFLEFESEVPEDMARLIQYLEGMGAR
jgi:23S rRNA pseudouridine1911/1915/1917 synthase